MNSTPVLDLFATPAAQMEALWARLEADLSLNNATGLRATVSNPILRTERAKGETPWDHVELDVILSRGQYNGKPAPEYAANHWQGKVTERFTWRMGLGLIDWKAEARKPIRRMSWGSDADIWAHIHRQGTYGLRDSSLRRVAATMLPAFVKAVKPIEVLARACSDAKSSDCAFESWCADFGGDSDSISSLETYRSCQTEGLKARRLVDHNTFDKLAELANRL